MRRLRFWLLAASLVFATTPAYAEFPEGVPDTFRLRLGAFFADLETEVGAARLGVPLGGLVFSYENDLDLDASDSAFRLDGTWRLSRHFALDFGYIEFDRASEKQILRIIEFEGFTFTVGAEVRGTFESQNIYGAFRYDFVNTPSVQFGLSLGVDWFDLNTELSAAAGVVGPNGQPIVGEVSRGASVSVPAPVLGAQVAFVVVPRFVTVTAYARYMGLDVDKAEGSVIDASARADWFIIRNFGIGLSYDWSELDLDRLESGDFEYSFRYEYSGPRAFLIVTF